MVNQIISYLATKSDSLNRESVGSILLCKSESKRGLGCDGDYRLLVPTVRRALRTQLGQEQNRHLGIVLDECDSAHVSPVVVDPDTFQQM